MIATLNTSWEEDMSVQVIGQPPLFNGNKNANKYLSSWKEIAQYFGRGVRTVQRWEERLGMPVRRPHGKSRSAVMAITEELDQWMANASLRDGLNLLSEDADMKADHDTKQFSVLLMEDSFGSERRSATESFGSRFKVEVINGLQSALQALDEIDSEERPLPDLIVLDQGFFGTNGHQIFSRCFASSRLARLLLLVRPTTTMQQMKLVA
jgi:hypothetical protein